MAESDETALLRLLTWLSPAFPVGGYAYSHGIEAAIEAGLIRDAAGLQAWIEQIVRRGSGLIDAAFLARAWDTERNRDDAALGLLAEQADARRGTAEAALESTAQGQAFLAAVRAGWPHPRLDAFVETLARLDRPPSYACVVGVVAAIAGIPRSVAVIAFLHAFAANLISAGVKLVPLGQRDGLRVLAALEPAIRSAPRQACEADLDDIGTATWRVDLVMARHETQHVRLFRS